MAACRQVVGTARSSVIARRNAENGRGRPSRVRSWRKVEQLGKPAAVRVVRGSLGAGELRRKWCGTQVRSAYGSSACGRRHEPRDRMTNHGVPERCVYRVRYASCVRCGRRRGLRVAVRSRHATVKRGNHVCAGREAQTSCSDNETERCWRRIRSTIAVPNAVYFGPSIARRLAIRMISLKGEIWFIGRLRRYFSLPSFFFFRRPGPCQKVFLFLLPRDYFSIHRRHSFFRQARWSPLASRRVRGLPPATIYSRYRTCNIQSIGI